MFTSVVFDEQSDTDYIFIILGSMNPLAIDSGVSFPFVVPDE